MKEAFFYEKSENNNVFCRLCPRLCRIKEGSRGFCRARENKGGVLYSVNYGRVSSVAMDPIEKKPLYHFHPGTEILSLGSFGCNLACGFCQNWPIAHADPPTRYFPPEAVVAAAAEQVARGVPCVGIAYTYNEPFIWYEYVYDTARRAREKGLKNVLVTNGYVSEEALVEILPYIDAMNIDVKGFTAEYYREVCRGSLEPVLRAVELAARSCHVELTTLLVPGLNDSAEEIRRLSDWVASLDPEIPLHFSRYFPQYKFDLPPTPLATLLRARELAREKLRYVYIGNAPELGAGDTTCPSCGDVLIRRRGYRVEVAGLEGNNCRSCGEKIRVVV